MTIFVTKRKATSIEAGVHKTVVSNMTSEAHPEWVRQMNACRAQAEAIVKFELIYD